MNRANIVIIVIAAAVLLVAGNAQTNRTESAVGRYQLLAGEHDVAGKTATFTQKDIFRIDTATGATSFYAAGYDKDGKVYFEWLSIK